MTDVQGIAPGPDVPRPHYFGPAQRPLFGWLYLPTGSVSADIGVVICNPFGDEAIRANRALRHLATEAVGAGLPTLRFDYDGTGDSAGHDLDADRLEHWLASIHAAAATLRESTGVARICLVGLRLGAALAALAAAGNEAVAGLIAVAPVLNGKSYVRELRLLRKAIDAKRNIVRTESDTTLETAGFLLTQQTQSDLAALDLVKSELTPPERMLVIDRAEVTGGSSAWVEQLRGRGAQVEHVRATGFAEMMLDSHDSMIPAEIIHTAGAWLRQLVSGRPTIVNRASPANTQQVHAALYGESVPDPVTEAAPDVMIEEWPVRFGGALKLFGIVSASRGPSSGPGGTRRAAVLLNAGAVNHIGPCRLYVSLARHLARSGYVVLRLDIAGIGDSPARPGEPENIVYSRDALQDVMAALEYLRTQWGAGETSAIGLCSGAYHAFKAAVARYPVTHAVMINPLTFFWKEGMSLEYSDLRVAADMGRYRRNVRSLAAWRKLLEGKVNLLELTRVMVRHATTTLQRPLRSLARTLRIPLEDDLPSELLQATRARIELRFIFAASDHGVELLRSQGGATARRLVRRGRMGEVFIPDADHTFTDLRPRRAVAAAVIAEMEVTDESTESESHAEAHQSVQQSPL